MNKNCLSNQKQNISTNNNTLTKLVNLEQESVNKINDVKTMEVISKKCIQEIHSNIKKALQTKNCPKSTKQTREKQVKSSQAFLLKTLNSRQWCCCFYPNFEQAWHNGSDLSTLFLNMHSPRESTFN